MTDHTGDDAVPEPPPPSHYTLRAIPLDKRFGERVHIDVMHYEAREGALFFLLGDARRMSIPLSRFIFEITPHYNATGPTP